MARRFLIQLLPIGILAGLFFGLGGRVGFSDAGRFWIYSCTLSVGGSVGAAGFVGIGPFSKEPVPIIGSQAEFGNRTMGCKVQ